MGYWQYMWVFQHAMFDYQGYIPGSQDHSGLDTRDPKHGWPLNMVPFFPRFGNGTPLVFWLICHHNKHQSAVHMFFSTFFIMFHHYIQLKSHWITLKIPLDHSKNSIFSSLQRSHAKPPVFPHLSPTEPGSEVSDCPASPWHCGVTWRVWWGSSRLV